MVTLDIFSQVYAVSAAIGTAFLTLSVVTGRIGHGHGAGGHSGFGHHGGGHAGGIGHGGGAHSAGIGHAAGHAGGHGAVRIGGIGQSAAQATGITHSGAHATGHLAGHSGHTAGAAHGSGHVSAHGAGHSGAHGTHGTGHASAASHAASHGASSDNQGSQPGQPATNASGPLKFTFPPGRASLRSGSIRLAHLHPPENGDEELAQKIFGLVNPFFISVFLTFFGVTGLILSLSTKSSGAFYLIPAIAVGLFVNWLLKALIRWMFEKLESSSSAIVSELIGQPAAVSVPIAPERVGEITYIVQSKRYNLPAKAADSSTEFKRGSQVIISDIADNIAYVEPWTDPFVPGFNDILPHAAPKTLPILPDENSSQSENVE